MAHSSELAGSIRQRGVSLIELMVAMVIALLIAAAIGSLYLGSRQSATLQSGTSAARESATALIEEVSREIRRAGNYGCFVARDVGIGAGFLTTAKLPLGVGNRFPIPMDGSGPSALPRVGPNFAVYGDVNNYNTGTLVAVPNSDFLEFNYGEPATFLNGDMASGTDPLQLGQPVFMASGMPFLVTTCTRMTLLRADNGGLNGANSSTMSHDPALGDNIAQSSEQMYHKFPRGAAVMRLLATQLFVAKNITDSTTNLYRLNSIASNGGTPQPFAANVMDMRARFAVDNAGTINWLPGATVTAGANWPKVLAVRLHFVVASSETSAGSAFEMTWDEAKGFLPSATVAADKKPRRAYTVTTAIHGRVDLGSN